MDYNLKKLGFFFLMFLKHFFEIRQIFQQKWKSLWLSLLKAFCRLRLPKNRINVYILGPFMIVKLWV